VSARADVQLDAAHALIYLTAVRQGDFDGQYSAVGTTSAPAPTDAAFRQHERYQGITHDLRVSGAADQWRWMVGAYALREGTRIIDDSIATSYLSVLGPGSVGDALDGRSWYGQRGISHSRALVGEVGVKLRPSLWLSAGLRHTDDRKRYRNTSRCLDHGARSDFLLCVVPLGAEVWDISTRRRWRENMPRLGLDWQVRPDVLLYLSVARGFKGGGWQGRPGTREAALYPYDPEAALTYEIGGKASWAAERLRLSAAMFHTDFDDLQVEQVDDSGLALITDNAAAARIDGVEMELQAQVTLHTQLHFAGSYLSSEYRQFIDSRGVDLSGRTLARAPRRSFSAGLTHVRALSEVVSLQMQLDMRWQDVMAWVVENTVAEASYGVVDARLGLTSVRGWEVAVLGSNLTNRLYRTDVIAFLGDVFSRFGPPRSYRLQVSQTF
jgi:iron complex outermembrane receptor protein